MQQRNDKGGFDVLWWYNIHAKFHEYQLVHNLTGCRQAHTCMHAHMNMAG